jgi:hypothetical protein
MTAVLPLIGGALLVLLVVDVFSTVFSPSGRGGPINRRQNRALWLAFRRAALRRDGSIRRTWLSLAGPVLVVATLTVWMLWLVGAFALVYFPRIDSFLVSPGASRAGWAEAVYYSGYAAATLGLGDLVADSEALRLLTILEAFGGFALLSASVTYFLAVYRELIRKQALASSIASYFRGGQLHTLCSGASGRYDMLARWGESISSTLTAVLLAHFQYPVLHYFSSAEATRALPVQLGHLLRLRRMVREAGAEEAVSTLAENPSYLALQEAVEEYVREVERLFVPLDDARRQSQSAGDQVERAHRRLLAFTLQGDESDPGDAAAG